MAISNEVLEELIRFWTSRASSALIPEAKIAKEVIERVLKMVDRSPNDPVDADVVKFAIAQFQRMAGISGNPGVLTKGLAEAIKRLIVMDDNREPTTTERITAPVSDGSDRGLWVRYFVNTDTLKSFAGPTTLRRLCAEAWGMWLEHTAHLLVREVNQPGPGVVEVTAGTVDDGVGNAKVAGPKNFNRNDLKVELDLPDINASNAVFRSIVAHEFGHIIGIGHLGQTGNLMSVTVLDSVVQPTPTDIAAAQRIYGAPGAIPPVPTAPPTFPTPGDF
jgi:hypothetical protein